MSKNEKSKILKIFFFSVFFRFFFQTNYRKKKINYKKIKKKFNFQKYFTELKIGHKKCPKSKKKYFLFFIKIFHFLKGNIFLVYYGNKNKICKNRGFFL